MATKAQLEASLNSPNMQYFLRLIAKSEGVGYGYNTLFGNTAFSSLNDHPNIKVPFTDKTGKRDYSTAAGAYQFLSNTWYRIKKALNLPDFSGHNQDLAAAYLIAENGALNNVLAGDYAGAVNKLGGVWASLPSSKYKATQNSKTWEEIGLADAEQSSPTGLKKYLLQLPVAKLFGAGIVDSNTVINNPDGILAGAGEVLDNYTPDPTEYINAAGNFALRSVVIITAVALIVVGFYFMFKKEIMQVVT